MITTPFPRHILLASVHRNLANGMSELIGMRREIANLSLTPAEAMMYHVPEFALSEAEGRAAFEDIRPAIEAMRPGDQPIVLDMTACHVLCTHWLSGFYSPLFDRYPIGEVEAAIRVVGASPTNQQAVDLMYQAAAAWAQRNQEQVQP